MPERVEPVETISPSVSSGPFAASRVVATGRTNAPTHQAAYDVYQKIAVNIGKVMQGQADSTRKLLAALASGGHGVLGDFPRTGKTTPAKAPARAIVAPRKRNQIPPDPVPSAILRVSALRPHHHP